MNTITLPVGETGAVDLIDGETWPAVKALDGAVWVLSPRDVATDKWHRYGPLASALLVERHWRPSSDGELLAEFSRGLTS